MVNHRASCQCGSVSVEATADPDFVIVCNCKACQKRSGSPFGAGGYFRKDAVTVNGQPKSWKRTADSGRALENFFCPECGTTLYWTLEMRPDHLGIPYGLVEPPLSEPIRAIWTEEKHPWVRFPDAWPTYPKGSPG
jgi:hypothetical protein